MPVPALIETVRLGMLSRRAMGSGLQLQAVRPDDCYAIREDGSALILFALRASTVDASRAAKGSASSLEKPRVESKCVHKPRGVLQARDQVLRLMGAFPPRG